MPEIDRAAGMNREETPAGRWQNFSPGDLSIPLPEVQAGDVSSLVAAAVEAAPAWARTPFPERIARLRQAQQALAAGRERLAHGIALETGKPITEALGEVAGVLAKIDLTIADAEEHLAEQTNLGGPHPALVRRCARGPAAVIGPFNFPLHLGHGANVAHLLAGNPVIFKPSPLAANVAADYGTIMTAAFPPGVFAVCQGGGAEGQALCLDPRVRAVCFTGSVPVGRALASALAEDFAKEVALELGGSNALIVCADADLGQAAIAAAEGACLTAGQRCNATSRVIVERPAAAEFQGLFLEALAAFQPGDPLLSATRLGPLINAPAVARYEKLLAETPGDWLLPGKVEPVVAGKRGHYVRPAVALRGDDGRTDSECFVPLVHLYTARDLDEAVAMQKATPFGLTASIFTRSEALFRQLGDQLEVGNLYANLPTTFSPSALPFGGWKNSGNGRPGGRGFIRFATREQAVQWTALE
ncbi:MAG: RHH-type transcriptional regulator, proline utilization regulon repressor / proline dehydrogenase [Chthoniobacter sp.]|jgi:acyl-CoA reductase-like NAD-dependent aldehyde dehydrogenase|nr:RHH-type transcriptional regulator, proline utilization regulon repressor / proline dehydrogenase [Chthoniobacter sp.]